MKKEFESVWMKTVNLPSFPKLEKDINTDVLIVGGGMAGILCAYTLSKMGVDYTLCEAGKIAAGTTSCTTAVLSAQHDTLYSDMINSNDEQFAKSYLQANLEALDKYRDLSNQFDFDFEEKPSCIYSTTDREKMEKEVMALHALGFCADFKDEIPLPVEIKGAVFFPNQAQMHPLKFINGICKNLNIYEHTMIYKVENNVAYTEKNKIKAKKIIIASHFPILNKHGLYFAKLYQKRSYVIALENAQDNIEGTYVDNKENGMYFRNYKNLLILGGGDHRTGKTGGNFEELRKFIKKHYPDAKEKYTWITQDCMSLDGIPYIGAYSKSLPDVYVASGFNEWGMTTSMVAAEILSDMVTGKGNPYTEIFSPSRSMLKAQLFNNLGSTTLDMITPTTKRCPHLGCALKWNKLEHSWDCPCHGSRFSEDGELLNNPATGNLK